MNEAHLFLAHEPQQISACFEVFSVLRPHVPREQFLPQVLRQSAQGYQILALQEGCEILSVAGFRITEFLAWGRILYLDDLSTLPAARGRGHAGKLLDWLADYAQQHDCCALHLDTGHNRHAAHRLYLNKGFVLNSHHMVKALATSQA